jgi:hypothetical protein
LPGHLELLPRLGRPALLVEEDLAVAAEGLLPVLAEGDLPLADLDVPGLLRRAEKRLCKTHDAKLPVLPLSRTERFALAAAR